MPANSLKKTKRTPRKIKFYSHSIKEQVREALISQAYHLSNTRLITGCILGAIVWLRLRTLNETFILNTWFITLQLIMGLRIASVYLYTHAKNPGKNSSRWHNIFIIGVFCSGTSWGIVPFLFFQETNTLQQLLILIILSGITASSIVFMSGILIAALVFVSVTLLPLMVYFIIPPHHDLLMAVTVCIYLVSLMLQAIKYNEILIDDLLLQLELTEAKNLLEKTATHDPLTKVSNRILFSVNLVEAIEDAKKHHKLLGLLYLDLNKFKIINDTHGHAVGDKILLIFTQRLKQLFKEEDIVSRIGGDEFTVLLKDIADPTDIPKIIARIHQAMAVPLVINHLTFKLSVSIGSSLYPSNGTDPETLLSVADHEMYRSKKQAILANEFQPSVDA